jgi:general secretion pathway protein A
MYLNFYGLKEKPFNTTPDPKFLFLTAGHREALAQLVYGVQEAKGFIVLSAEIGTGKTTLLQALLRQLDGTNTAVAYVFNSTLGFDGILEYMLRDFGIEKGGDTRAARLFALNNFLIERRRSNQNTVLIIDEAQNLDPPTLEEVRLLSNFESPSGKLLQIVLAGQPELNHKLALPELRQLRQRVALRCTIPALDADETREFIRTRLRIAGARDVGIFTDRAVKRIAEWSGGIPRLINIACDHCLLVGYADEKKHVDRDIVDRAIKYFEAGDRPRGVFRRAATTSSSASAAPPASSPVEWALRGVAAVLVGVAVLAVAGSGALDTWISPVSHMVNVAAQSAWGWMR